MNIKFENLINDFNIITNKPENFISSESDHANEIKSFVKNAYDFTKEEEEKSKKTNALPELIIEDFDLEQIWQQLELQNEDVLKVSLPNVSKFAVMKQHLLFHELDKDLSPEENDDEENDGDGESSSDSEKEEGSEKSENSDEANERLEDSSDNEDLDQNEGDLNNKAKFNKRSVVDDEFFKLDEMEQFLKAEEKALDKEPDDDSGNESKEDEEEIDYFKNSDEEDGEEENEEDLREKNPRYKDFFRPSDTEKPIKRNKFLEEESDEADDKVNETKSSFELQQERMKNKIKILEDIVLSEKPWQLQGEITAENRPQNSLLEEIVEFDLTSRPAPVITENTTLQLDDIIRQRIKDKVFDSVERKERPVETPLEYKKKLVLDQEKSKESLAQIYEKEYLQQVETAAGTAEDKEEEEPESHREIRKMMQNLFKQLDALSNYHFTPKPAAPELKIVSNLPAITMEEVAPVATTDAALLAPEEVRRRIKGDIIGKTERTDADKNRERRKKKLKQKIHANRKNKLENQVGKISNPGLGNKYTKEKMKKQLEKVIRDKNVDKMDESLGSKTVKSSTAFFKQLEDEVKSQIKVRTQVKRKSNAAKGLSAKKIKL